MEDMVMRTLDFTVEVKGATVEGGLLKIELVREVPEAMKPRRIAIGVGNDAHRIEHKKAA
jgi:molecular chaperone IbpA